MVEKRKTRTGAEELSVMFLPFSLPGFLLIFLFLGIYKKIKKIIS
ncbi:MAG: hypothetical protein QXX01_03095 [Candidatus Aenigmatarchaeota archaeon]